MNSTTTNLQKISFIFFAIIGSVHLLSGLMLGNEYFPKISLLLNRSLDIPFIITGLLYGFSSLKKITDPDETNKISTYLFIFIGAIILAGIIYINFFIPDRPIDL